MTRILCLANSFKRGGRCIAGIDLETNRWIRPIGQGHEGAIRGERLINGMEPELLDIIEIPLGAGADDLGCQPENILLRPGPWRKVGVIEKDDVMQYVEETDRLLHNFEGKVPLNALLKPFVVFQMCLDWICNSFSKGYCSILLLVTETHILRIFPLYINRMGV